MYDDEHDDIAQFFEATNAFISKVCTALQALLVLLHKA